MSMDFALPSTIALAFVASAADFTTALNEGLSFSADVEAGRIQGHDEAGKPFMPMDLTMDAGGGEGTVLFNKDTFSIKSQAAGSEHRGGAGHVAGAGQGDGSGRWSST
jgi:hypothetical protein